MKNRNYHSFTLYWAWKVNRLGFMIWIQNARHLFNLRLIRRSDGGWLLFLPFEIMITWEGSSEA